MACSTMKRFSTLLLLLLALFQCLHSSEAQTASSVHVDSVRGVLDSTCCSGGPNIPCKTLTLALECVYLLPPIDSATVMINDGVYGLIHNRTLTVFYQRSGGISLIGNASCEGCVNVWCDENAGLSFIESDNIVIENLVFTGCGFPNNSTSKDFSTNSSDPHFLEVNSALYFLMCTHVTLSHVVVQYTDGIGVVMYSTVGEITIASSAFIANQRNLTDDDKLSGGGGLYIEFPYCKPGDTSCFNGSSNIPENYTSSARYYISNTRFTENLGNMSDPVKFTFILPQKSNHLAFGRGGGLSVFFKGHSSDNSIVVNGSAFTNNRALWGGGIFVEHHDWSSNNNFSVYNSQLEDNECLYKNSSSKGTGGGGARVGYIFFGDTHAKSNSIHFENCTFTGNSAYFGGGLSIYAAREPTESSPTNSLVFVNTTWQENVARAGSAADLSVWHTVPAGAVAITNFTDCRFSNNSGSYTSELSTVVGIGALYLDSIPVHFMGKNIFELNTHSALAAVSTGIYLTSGCSVQFLNNKGRHGGGVALLGYAFLEVLPNSEFLFINNTAEIKGGAIYQLSIGEHDLINSRNCFIRYGNIEVTPDLWNSTFYFSGNRANNRENSIYATSLITCQWGGEFGNSSADLSDVFCWSNRWEYASGNCTSEVHSAPATFEPTNANGMFNLTVIPGEPSGMPLIVQDDRNADVTGTSVFIARSLSDGVYVDESTEYISDNRIEVHAAVDEGHTVQGVIELETIDPRVVHTKLNVTVLSCPPGMARRGEGNLANCVCRGSYGGQVICNATAHQAKLQRGSWIGYYTYKGHTKTVVSSCPYCSSFSEQLYLDLPRNSAELESQLCNKVNRKGTLCGQCLEGYGATLYNNICIKCGENEAKYMWLYYIIIEYVPLTVFFLIVVIFDIRATSAAANAFVFFAQVVPTAFTLDGSGIIYILLKHTGKYLPMAYRLPYDIWNLQFFSPLQDRICLSPHLSTLQVISITYMAAVYPLLLICIISFFIWLYGLSHKYNPIVFVCRPLHSWIARCQQKFKIQVSLIHTFATFILLSYSRLTLVSFYLLTKTPFTTDEGGTFGPPHGVVYYDGTIPYLSGKHMPYVALAVLVLTTFVAIPPILLSLPSILRNMKTIMNSRPWGIRLMLKLDALQLCGCSTSGWPKFQQFLAAFHGCYKDGTERNDGVAGKFDYRWFAGLYFMLRVIIFSIYAFTPEWFIQYTSLQFVCIAGILFFLLLRPYKIDSYNKLDAAMFSLLVAINTLTMYNYYITILGNTPSVFAFSLQYILVLLPIIYISVVMVYYLHKKLTCCKRKVYSVSADNDEEMETSVDGGGGELTQSAPEEYLLFMEQTGRLHDVNEYRPLSASCIHNSEEMTLLTSPYISADAKTITTAGSSINKQNSPPLVLPGASNDVPNISNEPPTTSGRHTAGYGSMHVHSSQGEVVGERGDGVRLGMTVQGKKARNVESSEEK